MRIRTMMTNATKEYPTSEENVIRDNKTKGVLKIIHQRRLTEKKRVSNQWPDHQAYHSNETLLEGRRNRPRGLSGETNISVPLVRIKQYE